MTEKKEKVSVTRLQKEIKSLRTELMHAVRARDLAASFNVYRDHAKTEVAALLGLPPTATPIEIINQLRSIVAELEDLRKLLK